MGTVNNPNDAVTVAPGVIITLVQIAAKAVDGVADMGDIPSTVDRWISKTAGHEGVRLSMEEEGVRVDIYLTADTSRSLHETSRAVQDRIARTIDEYLGMKVLAVNVHVEDIVFPTTADREQKQ